MFDKGREFSYVAVRDELRRRLAEPPGHRVQMLSGPRQVGKTTLLLELAREWPKTAVYGAADSPAAALSGWWENLWSLAERAESGQPALVLIDEIQYLPEWSRLLKAKVDEFKRRGILVHIVVTGSSALSIGYGSRESVAGRFERLRLVHWQAADIANAFDKTLPAAAYDVVRFGGYPGAVGLESDPHRWQAYVRDSIVEPAIGRDLLAIEAIRKPALLRQIFAVAVGHPAQIVSLQKIRGRLTDQGALETIAHYLHLLEEAYLVAALPKYAGNVVRQRAAPPKLVALNNALLSTEPGDAPPSPASDPVRWGRWVENACIAMAWNRGQTVSYWREEPLEVDFVSTGTWGNWAVEVKTGQLEMAHLRGIFEFCRRNPAFRPAVICEPESVSMATEAGITAISWTDFLVGGLG